MSTVNARELKNILVPRTICFLKEMRVQVYLAYLCNSKVFLTFNV